MSKVRVVTDSASDLPDDLAAQLNIDVIPLSIRFGEEEFVDRRDLTPAQFWAKCKSSKHLPETAAPAPGAFQQAFERAAAAGYDGVIVVALSEVLSATHQAATLGAQAVDGVIDVRVVDTRAVSMAQGLIAIEVAEAAATGASLEDLVTLCENLSSRVGVIGTVNTLEHLIKGGRLKGAKALLGSALAIKPLLALKDGLVSEAGRARTRTKALAQCAAAARAAAPLQRMAIAHGSADDIDGLIEELRTIPCAGPLINTEIGSVVGTHGGPGIVAVCWISA